MSRFAAKIFERWGTIKNGRYKKSELRQDDLFDKVKYTGWLVNNDSHHFHYAPYDFEGEGKK